MTISLSDLPDHLPDFNGRLVAFYVANHAGSLSGGVVLNYPEFQLLGGRLFVTGRSPELSAKDWCSNLPSAVAWDSVIHYLVFASHEDYLQRGKRAPDSWLHRLSHRLT